MAGRGGGRESGEGRDAQRARERAARERAREQARAKTDEQALEARVRQREEAMLRAAAADRKAEEAREHLRREAAEREARAARASAAAASASAEPASPPPAPARRGDDTSDELFEDFGLPPYARPETRAGRERQAVFAPAQPAPPAPTTEAPRGREGARRRPAGAGAGAGRVAGVLAALLGLWGRLLDLGRRRPPVAFAAVAAGIVLVAGIAIAAGGGDDGGSGDGDGGGDAASAAAETRKARAKSPYGVPTDTPLPPESRIVAYTGAPQAEELGILGTMPFEQASDRLDRQAKPYDRKSRPVLRAFDLIATIANADPGTDGKYRTRQSSAVIARYLRAARRHDAMLILDVQPGGSNFIDETEALERWLKEPDVHLALDPEWRMRPGVRPGSEIGYVSAGEITATLDRVADIVADNDLPPKLVLVHRFTDGMIRDLGSVEVPKSVVGVISIDGVGSRPLKESTYDRIAPTLPKPWLAGFKLFYEEDAEAGGVMYGSQVMALKPRPHVVLYE